MNTVQLGLALLAAVFLALLAFRRKFAFTYARLTLLILVGTLTMMPFAWLICSSFKDPSVMNAYTFLPPVSKISSETVNLHNFQTLFKTQDSVQGPVPFVRYVANSVFLASAGTIISLFFCSLAGYALAKFKFPGRGPVLAFMLASMTIPSVVLLAPNFEIIYRLGWMDTYKALLLPGAVSVFGIFLFRQAMTNVPEELLEAGRMDGCGEFRIYFQLAMPLVRPMTGAYCLISFLGAWNAFLGPNIFLQTQRKLPLSVVLNQYIGVYQQEYGVFLAGTLLAIIPPAILFFALQKEFISGLTSGALKQ